MTRALFALSFLGLAACGAAGPPMAPQPGVDPLEAEEIRVGPSAGPVSGPPTTSVDISGTASMGVSGSF